MSPVHGTLVPAKVVFDLGIENKGVEDGAQNQVVFFVPLQKGPEGPFPKAAIRSVKKGEHLASGELLFLSLRFEMEGKGPGEFIEEGCESRPPGEVLPAEDLFFLFAPGKRLEAPEKMQGVFVNLQRRMGKKFLEFLLGEADQGQAEEKKLILQLVPLLLGFLQEGFVFVVLGVLGEEKAGIKKGLNPFFLDGFVFFQGLEKSGRREKGKISPPVGSLKLPGPVHPPNQVLSPAWLSGGLVEIG
jgi:hypothetical protein